jgi:hypothetical protein
MTDFFMSHIAAIPTNEDSTNHANGYKGIVFGLFYVLLMHVLILGSRALINVQAKHQS